MKIIANVFISTGKIKPVRFRFHVILYKKKKEKKGIDEVEKKRKTI